MTVYASSSFQFAKLVGGLAGLNMMCCFPKKGRFRQNLSFSTTKNSIPQIWHNWNLTCFTHKKMSMSRPSIWYRLRVSGQNGEILVIFSPKGTSLVNRAWKRLILPIFGRRLQKIVIFFLQNFKTKMECLSFLFVLVSVKSQ